MHNERVIVMWGKCHSVGRKLLRMRNEQVIMCCSGLMRGLRSKGSRIRLPEVTDANHSKGSKQFSKLQLSKKNTKLFRGAQSR